MRQRERHLACCAALSVAALAIASAAEAQQALCIQPVAPSEIRISSEYNEPCAIISEVANNCHVLQAGILSHVTWWGGPLDAGPVTPGAAQPPPQRFNLRFYGDAGCKPGAPIVEYLDVIPEITLVSTDSLSAPLYRYEMEVNVPVGVGTFWFAPQQIIMICPPQGGRGGDGGDFGPTLCGCMYRSPTHGYPAWTAVTEIVGAPWEASQRFEYMIATPDARSSWGTLKSLYR
jgi:hypothetical protein